MDDHEHLDERIARLQRVAYGADVPDEDRDAAARELAALRPPRADGSTGQAVTDAATTAPSGEAPPDGADTDDGTRASSTGARSVTAIVLALVTGLAVGWALGALSPRADDAGAVPTAESTAWRVFDAPVPNGDRVRYPAPPVEVDLDRDSRRLLAARSDGVRVVAVRSEDGRDACLVLVVPSGPSAAACTADGRFPADGLEVRTEQPDTGTFSATWDATGRVSLGPAEPGD